MAGHKLGRIGALLLGAVALTGCAAPGTGSGTTPERRCSDLVASALTSPDAVVRGSFACMSPDEQNFWHRWAISTDDQLQEVVHNHGMAGSGLVDGFAPQALWTWASFKTELDPDEHLYLVGTTDRPGAQALLVITTTGHGLVESFDLHLI